MNAWKTILAVAVIFLAGLVTGGTLVWNYAVQLASRPASSTESGSFEPWQLKDRYLGYLAKKLDLTPNQQESISKIVTESQQRTKILFESVGPEMREEMHHVRDAIRAVLSPDQQTEFDEIQKRHDRHRKEDKSGSDSDSKDPKMIQKGDDPTATDSPTFKSKCQNKWLLEEFIWPPLGKSCRSS